MFGERISVHLDSPVGRFDIRSFERRLADNESVNNYTEGPQIDLIGVSCFAFQDLRGDIVRSTANGSFLFTIEIKFGCKPKISNFYFHLLTEEEVAELQVSVNDPVLVQVLERVDHLEGVALDFKFVQSLSSSQQLVHALVLAELEKDIHVFAIFEEVLELYDILVLDRPVDLDLRHQLLFGTTLG